MRCEIRYFPYMLTCLACVYILIKIFFMIEMYLSSCRIIYLRVTNLLATPNYFFTLQFKLFYDVDSFVCDISSTLFILNN